MFTREEKVLIILMWIILLVGFAIIWNDIYHDEILRPLLKK